LEENATGVMGKLFEEMGSAWWRRGATEGGDPGGAPPVNLEKHVSEVAFQGVQPGILPGTGFPSITPVSGIRFRTPPRERVEV